MLEHSLLVSCWTYPGQCGQVSQTVVERGCCGECRLNGGRREGGGGCPQKSRLDGPDYKIKAIILVFV